MSIPNKYRDSDKSLNNSAEDYSTLSNYHNSFYTATKTSLLRMAMVPGTVKYFNKAIEYDPQTDMQISESAFTPLPQRKKATDEDSDYATYPKLKNN
jgi:hypothetical protein